MYCTQSILIDVLSEYINVRGGDNDSYLFPNSYNEILPYSTLKCNLVNYHKSRDVDKISIHLYRYPNLYQIQTFLSKYLILLNWDRKKVWILFSFFLIAKSTQVYQGTICVFPFRSHFPIIFVF